MRCADAGADMVRITVQGMKEADACHAIREELFRLRCDSLPSLPHLSAPLSKLTAE
jgi:4-hydroxy-3-methylbut-2-en-1-yl diphosphate synthase IspG/GcpE